MRESLNGKLCFDKTFRLWTWIEKKLLKKDDQEQWNTMNIKDHDLVHSCQIILLTKIASRIIDYLSAFVTENYYRN